MKRYRIDFRIQVPMGVMPHEVTYIPYYFEDMKVETDNYGEAIKLQTWLTANLQKYQFKIVDTTTEDATHTDLAGKQGYDGRVEADSS